MTQRSQFHAPRRGVLACLALTLTLLVACGDAKPTGPLDVRTVFGMWDLESVNGHTLPTGIASRSGVESTEVLSGDFELRESGQYSQLLATNESQGVQARAVSRVYGGTWRVGGDHQLLVSIGPGNATPTMNGDVTVMTFRLDGDLYSYRKR